MIISAIVATANNNVIGQDNNIPWYLPADLKYFKKTTLGHHIIMGRKSFISIGRPLPKRTNIVVTRDPFFMASGCIVSHSINDAISLAKENGEEEVFIIGGGQVYEQCLPLLDRIYLTKVAIEVKGSVYFPDIEEDNWVLVNEEHHQPDDKNEHPYTFQVLERKKR